MVCRIKVIPMTLSDLEGHSPVASLFSNGIFSYSCAAVDKISTDRPSCIPSAIAEYFVATFSHVGHVKEVRHHFAAVFVISVALLKYS